MSIDRIPRNAKGIYRKDALVVNIGIMDRNFPDLYSEVTSQGIHRQYSGWVIVHINEKPKGFIHKIQRRTVLTLGINLNLRDIKGVHLQDAHSQVIFFKLCTKYYIGIRRQNTFS